MFSVDELLEQLSWWTCWECPRGSSPKADLSSASSGVYWPVLQGTEGPFHSPCGQDRRSRGVASISSLSSRPSLSSSVDNTAMCQFQLQTNLGSPLYLIPLSQPVCLPPLLWVSLKTARDPQIYLIVFRVFPVNNRMPFRLLLVRRDASQGWKDQGRDAVSPQALWAAFHQSLDDIQGAAEFRSGF